MTLLSSTLLAVSLLASPPAKAPEAKEPDRVVIDRVAAIVNGQVVTLQELIARAGEELRGTAELPEARREEAVSRALRRAFDDVVADRLLSIQAKELGFEATEAQVDQMVEEIKKNNNLDDEKLKQALAGLGQSMEEFRDQQRRMIEAWNVLRYRVRSRVKITDEDLQNYYQAHRAEFAGEEQVKVRHIFLPLPESATPAEEAKVRADGQKALQRLATGEDFAKVAREISKGPGAEDGGDLGWLARGTIQKSLEDVAFALKTGEVSELVRAGPGLHLFKVEDRRTSGGRSFEEAKAEITDRLTNEQAETYRLQYLAELRRDAIIELKIPELKEPSRS
ncbi:MAG TPA: peptidylprolyl isomerase [Anaeromyxobacteraceae bacterium]|nr:peptidylprolyl isomerase [Anaeromyxobacteraceae bacterium]